jgi:PAS domain S-box-containing protein
MKAALPLNEVFRIKALHDLAILDSPREQSFDDIAQVAMHMCDVPIAVVSLVDNNRQWFKSCLGLDATETPRDLAFCAHAILTPDDVLVVEDTLKDPRFFNNGLVTGAPYIRFYAGAPLVTREGAALGTLCVIDYKPRALSDQQKNSLKALARQVIQLLKLKSTNDAVQGYSTRMQLIADKVPVLIGELDRDYRYTFANQKHKDWLDMNAQNLLGKTPADIFPSEQWPAIREAIDMSFAGLKTHIEVALPDGRVLDINYQPANETGEITSVFEVASDVTERKQHTEILQRERARLESIIEGTNIGTWEWNINTGDVLVNERWVSMLGYTMQELQPITVQTWERLLHKDDVSTAFAKLEQHFLGESPFYDCQFRLLKKNGDWQWIHAHGKVAVRDVQGKPLIVSGMHTDIGEIKNAFNRLKEREDLLRSMFNNFPGAAYRCENNASWTMRYLSDAVEQLTGYPALDFLVENPRSFTDITHPDDVARVNEQVQMAVAEQQAFNIEYRIQRADGQWRHVQEIGRGVFNEAAELKFIDGFIWDIQSRVESDYEKQITSNKLAQLFEMAPIGILQVNEQGQLLEVNPEFTKMLGYSEAELKAMTFLDLTPPEDIPQSQLAVANIKSLGRFGPIEKNYLTSKGELLPVEISGSLINVHEGSELCWWTLVKDIHEQKRVERMKSEFISTVSHELRTPLTSISGALGLITNNMLGAVPDRAQAMLAIAYKNSQRLSLLIDDLLDMEKLIAGKMFFDFSVQSVVPLVQQALAENKAYADKYSVNFVLNDASTGALINIDAFRFQQILNNFLSNAAKYSPKNGHVDIDLDLDGEWLRVSVRDYGQGIPEEFKTRMFQKFSQADSSDSRQKSGTGLGLAISKELVERMGGKIGFESKTGHGTTFYAEFKRVQIN